VRESSTQDGFSKASSRHAETVFIYVPFDKIASKETIAVISSWTPRHFAETS